MNAVELPGDAAFRERCARLYTELVEANRSVNLTRIVDEADFYRKHVLDSLLLTAAYPKLAEKSIALADLGCGAGFPSLVLALRYPRWRITAIDSTGKKSAFTARMKELFGLDNLRVVNGRGRELDRRDEFRHAFDVVTARAVGEPARIVEETFHFPRSGGGWILYQTPERAEAALPGLGAGWRMSEILELPDGAGTRCFLDNIKGMR